MKIIVATLSSMLFATAMHVSTQSLAPTRACESLSQLALPHTTITLAEAVGAGGLKLPQTQPGGPPGSSPFSTLPSFCRVAATIAPTTDSEIRIEVWLPTTEWNGKFQAVGNGGWSGAIGYGPLATALRRGYAAASTDTGHAGASGSFALGHPEKLIDFGYRAVHEMTLQAKAIVKAFYGKDPRFSYWTGCSSGGKQGLKEAQRFPEDFDGIVAGAPANYWTHLMASGVWVGNATLKEASAYIPREKYTLLHRAVVEACDALDGVKDGLLQDPTRCRFDPKSLLCQTEDTASCLTAPQVEAAAKIYGGPVNPRTKTSIFPGLEPGSELGWGAMAGGPQPFPITADHFRFVVFKNPEWDFRTMDFDRDVALADRLDENVLNAVEPDLTRFIARRGKLILYHGWNDPLIAPRNTIDYYQKVVSTVGAARANEAVRLFMAPGMGHCAGGEGPNSFDMLAALEQWVETGKPPERITASHMTNGVVDRTRPLCPYPQVAQYSGSGSTDDAANFVCKVP